MRVILSARTAELLEEALGSLPPDVIVVPDPVDLEIYPETLERCERAAR